MSAFVPLFELWALKLLGVDLISAAEVALNNEVSGEINFKGVLALCLLIIQPILLWIIFISIFNVLFNNVVKEVNDVAPMKVPNADRRLEHYKKMGRHDKNNYKRRKHERMLDPRPVSIA